jgi:RNA polymerase sigma-70 factor, ECF subfamily
MKNAAALEAREQPSHSDEDLLELVAKRRDEAAFDEVYGRYAKAVYGLLRRLIGDRSEDVVQEAFTNVWRSVAGYSRERGPATGWLFAIARNAAVDALRLRASTGQSEAPGSPDDGPGPDRVASAEATFRVHAAVGGLSEREREVIELAHFEGISQSEVAARLGVPLDTVKTRTRSALAHLADRLAEQPERVCVRRQDNGDRHPTVIGDITRVGDGVLRCLPE